VLLAVPEARLLLRGTNLDLPESQRNLRARFAAHGVAGDRIVCEGYSPKLDYLRDFSRVDIALDPFPYNGVTTTLDTLWMGVPVVALAGDTTISRYGLALLTHAGHAEWVAATPEEYVAKAADLASDGERLRRIRQQLRGDLVRSPLCDSPGFTRTFQDALREIWRQWCRDPK
jgi:predicted O-linked N-acetylglucosamine transferase (SPINDLY family)